MAKHRRLRTQKINHHDLKQAISLVSEDDTTTQPKRWQSSTLLQPTLTPKPNPRLQRAHEKHSLPKSKPNPLPSPPSLSDHLNRLPPELRAHIFSFLLLRPPKWSTLHNPSCPARTFRTPLTSGGPPSTTFDLPPHFASTTCAACQYHEASDHRWRDFGPVLVYPWRSAWAPEQMNPYICTGCYDERWREGEFPKRDGMQVCICSRRENLEALLVCRKWYAEAGAVFYTGNTFAFEDPGTLVSFVENLPERWRGMISKVSLLVCVDVEGGYAYAEPSGRALGRAFRALRMLTGLCELELDARFLVIEKAVARIVRMGLTNVRRVRFVERRAESETQLEPVGDESMYPFWQGRRLLEGGFAEEVARVIKGQRRAWTKRPARIKERIQNAAEGELKSLMDARLNWHLNQDPM